MKFIAGLLAAMAISTVGVWAQAQAPAVSRPSTEAVTPPPQAQTDPTGDVTVTGCIRAWQPVNDPTKLPDNARPGVRGIFLLTPLNSAPNGLPTYVLTQTQMANFEQHLDDKVEVTGFAQAAAAPPTRETIGALTGRPENKPSADAMPRLTIRSLKKVSDSCP
jgi:hypothetical protein